MELLLSISISTQAGTKMKSPSCLFRYTRLSRDTQFTDISACHELYFDLKSTLVISFNMYTIQHMYACMCHNDTLGVIKIYI